MSLQDTIAIAITILFSLGGAGTIILGLSSWLGKVWATRILDKEKAKYSQDLASFKAQLSQEAERHRIKLKKSEFTFQKEYEAASKLVAINADIDPKHTHPEMDTYEAYDQIALCFDSIENILRNYLKEHGAILPAGVKDLIKICYGIAAQNKFDVDISNIPPSANSAAESLYGHMHQAEYELLKKVNEQVST